MNKIESFLEKQDKIILEDRNKILISLGITEKEYSPDGKASFKYSKYEYLNGEKVFYREVAMKVSDEEWKQILLKKTQVEEIKDREEQKREKEQKQIQNKSIKKWIPIFKKPKNEWKTDDQQVETGKSRLAFILRVYTWIFGIILFVSGIILSVINETFLPFLMTLGISVSEGFMCYWGAEILDYLAELNSIARNGFKYNESNK